LILLIAVSCAFVILLLVTIFNAYSNGHKARYAEAQSLLASAVSSLKDLAHHLDWCLSDQHGTTYNEKSLKGDLRVSLNALSQAFTLVTGVRCRATIKIVGADDFNAPEKAYVVTLARDEISEKESKER